MRTKLHDEWLEAKKRRDTAAYMLSKAFLAGNVALANAESVKFQAADTEMERLEKELDGRGNR